MNPQLSRISTELDEASGQARAVVASVPLALVGQRPHPGSWSVAECIAHLTMTTDAYLAAIRPGLDLARQQSFLDRGTPFGLGMSARLLAWWLEPPYRLKTKTRAGFVPGVEEPARALEDFLDRQQKPTALIGEADGLALDRIRIASPFAPQVKYNVYAALHLVAIHQRRHLWQAERVAATLLAGNPPMSERASR